MKRVFSRIWDSPTFMTWGSFLSRSLSLVIVLPLLLTRLETAEISLWYLFMTIIGLQMVVDAGFSPTFTRVISYIMGGAGVHELKAPQLKGSGTVDKQSLNRVYSTMSKIYFCLGLFWTGLLVTVGTLALIKPIVAVHDQGTAWIAWGIIIGVSSLSLYGNLYSSYLQGVNQIALLRRWETLTALGGIALSFLVLIAGGGLLALVIANQGWQVVNVIRNRWLARKVENGMVKTFVNHPFDREVFDSVWPSTWRSGVGVLMSYGLIQASGIIYAQVGNAASVASYLLALRLIQTVSQFSQAPFYSKLPLFARLYAENQQGELIQMAKRGMALSHWIYVVGFIALGLVGAPLFKYIESNAPFPDQLLWSLMGLGFFIERYGAMHIQLYSTTNRIIWHIANGIMGLIFSATSLMLLERIGIYAFPVGILAGYLGFYSWYAALHSYRAFRINFMSFEMRASMMPFVSILIYIGWCGFV